jgi:hypothetical protein
MVAYNVVRFRVKPGMEDQFLAAQQMPPDMQMEGWRHGALIKTGERTYCFIGEWDDFNYIVAARPAMISMLDRARPTLEDMGSGLGVTDPISGEAVIEYEKPN